MLGTQPARQGRAEAEGRKLEMQSQEDVAAKRQVSETESTEKCIT